MPSNKWLVAAGILLALLIVFSAMHAGTEWEGVDVAVVEKYAADLGQEAWTPFVNVEGDLLLFVFAVAGCIGGFAAGYCWRDLFGATPGKVTRDMGDAQPR